MKSPVLQYFLITPFTVTGANGIDKTTALAGLACFCIVGGEFDPTSRAEQGIRISWSGALGTLFLPQHGTTSLAIYCITIVQRAASRTLHKPSPSGVEGESCIFCASGFVEVSGPARSRPLQRSALIRLYKKLRKIVTDF